MTWMTFLSFENLAEQNQCKLGDQLLTIMEITPAEEGIRLRTRKHSSRMRTAHFSSSGAGGSGQPPGGQPPPPEADLPGGRSPGCRPPGCRPP